MRPVDIRQQSNSHTGMYVGGAIGGVTGYALTQHASGGFRGLGSILGTVAGGAIGNGMGNRPQVHQGVQIFVQVTDGYGRPNPNLISVVQDNDQSFRVGETVLLIRSRDGLSIAPADDMGSTP